jgi:Zinc finger, C2H2 type
LCLQYLTFECFDTELGKECLRSYIDQSYLAFQEYAVAHWTHHVESSVNCNVHFTSADVSESLMEFGTAISEFFSNYEHQLTTVVSNDEPTSRCKQFLNYEWHPRLEVLLRHIELHQQRGIEATDDISIQVLREVFFRNRKELEKVADKLNNKSEEIAKLSMFYGINWFRCSKLSCDYFHEGFPDNKRREQHMNRHDRPFRCTFAGCSGLLFGFDSAKALDKHIKNKHPLAGQITFAKLKDSKPPVSEFVCEICGSVFSRKFNLRTHMRAHTRERPFECTVAGCKAAFSRDSDRRRHETAHTGEKKYICGGNVSSENILKWGCGGRYARLEGLGRHFQSREGQTCLEPLWQLESEVQVDETDKAQKMRNAAVEKWRKYAEELELTESDQSSRIDNQSEEPSSGRKRNHTSIGSPTMDRLPPLLESPLQNGFPLPRAILEQYPSFNQPNWLEIGGTVTPRSSD